MLALACALSTLLEPKFVTKTLAPSNATPDGLNAVVTGGMNRAATRSQSCHCVGQ
jgi:hypothetical protein